MPLTRSDLQHLADVRAAEAAALVVAGLWSGAYYLAGYAVECALKSCIAKLTQAEEFPDKERATESFTHKLDKLVTVAGLKKERDAAAQADPAFGTNWDTVVKWNEASRYERKDEAAARLLYNAVMDPAHGVLPWVKQRW